MFATPVQLDVQKILNLMDGLVNSLSTSEMLTRIRDLRHELHGVAPSVILTSVLCMQDHEAHIFKELAVMRREQQTNTDGTYTYDAVMRIIRSKFGRERGGLKAWEDALKKDANPRHHRNLQTWRREDSYPVWAVTVLRSLPSLVCKPRRWSDDDREYLFRLYISDPSQSDEELSRKCSDQFDHEVNENAIKSKLHKLRNDGRISLRNHRTRNHRTNEHTVEMKI